MTTLIVRISTNDEIEARILAAEKLAEQGETTDAAPSLEFDSYEDMHRILAPLRLAIIKTLVGEAPLAIREIARRVGRDVQAVHRDVTTLINSGVIDRTEDGVVFPYDGLHFDFNVKAERAA